MSPASRRNRARIAAGEPLVLMPPTGAGPAAGGATPTPNAKEPAATWPSTAETADRDLEAVGIAGRESELPGGDAAAGAVQDPDGREAGVRRLAERQLDRGRGAAQRRPGRRARRLEQGMTQRRPRAGRRADT